MSEEYCYLAQIHWDFDEEEKNDNVIVYGSCYSEAMSKILENYADEDIIDVRLVYINDYLFTVPDDMLDAIIAFNKE